MTVSLNKPLNQVKIYYTAMLKESGRIFDSNVGKSACKFLLGTRTAAFAYTLTLTLFALFSL